MNYQFVKALLIVSDSLGKFTSLLVGTAWIAESSQNRMGAAQLAAPVHHHRRTRSSSHSLWLFSFLNVNLEDYELRETQCWSARPWTHFFTRWGMKTFSWASSAYFPCQPKCTLFVDCQIGQSYRSFPYRPSHYYRFIFMFTQPQICFKKDEYLHHWHSVFSIKAILSLHKAHVL
jgi:hypothetical protein